MIGRYPKCLCVVLVLVQKTKNQISQLFLPLWDVGLHIIKGLCVNKLQKSISITGGQHPLQPFAVATKLESGRQQRSPFPLVIDVRVAVQDLAHIFEPALHIRHASTHVRCKLSLNDWIFRAGRYFGNAAAVHNE
jgi:hypothetical protein